MTALALDSAQLAETRRVAREIGAAFGVARREAGDIQKQVAGRLGIRAEQVSRFENGEFPNVKLGNIVRYLALYRLTLTVTTVTDARACTPTHAHANNELSPDANPALSCAMRGFE